MKVCMTLSCHFGNEEGIYNGTSLHCMGVAKNLKRLGIEIYVVQFRGCRPLKMIKENWEGIDVYRIPFPLWNLYFFYLMKKLKPDIIHGQHVTGPVNSFLTSKMLGIPLIYEAHSFWIDEAAVLRTKKRSLPSPFFEKDKIGERIVLKYCDAIIVMSEKMKEVFANEYKAPIERMHLIYPGVDLNMFGEDKITDIEIEGVGDDDLVVMYAGGYRPWQGLDILFESIPHVSERIKNVKFVIIGGNREDIEKEKKKLHGIDNLIFLEKRPWDLMLSYFNKADILVIPRPNWRINWTTPRKIGEYMAAGKTIVATDVGDHKRILLDNDCGIITECNPKSFADGLITALSDEELRKRLGSNAKRTVKDKFDWNILLRRVIQIYEELLRKS